MIEMKDSNKQPSSKNIFSEMRKRHISIDTGSDTRASSSTNVSSDSDGSPTKVRREESIYSKLIRHNFHILLLFFLFYPLGIFNLRARFWIINLSCFLVMAGIIANVIPAILLIYISILYLGIVIFIYLELKHKERFFKFLFATDTQKTGFMRFFTIDFRVWRNFAYIVSFIIIFAVGSLCRDVHFAISISSIAGLLVVIFFVAFVSPWIYNKQLIIFSAQDEDLQNYFKTLDADLGYKVFLKYYDFRINWNDFQKTFLPLDIAQNISAVVGFIFTFVKVAGIDQTLGDGQNFISNLFQGNGFEVAAYFILGVGLANVLVKIVISYERGIERSLTSLKFLNYSRFLKFLTDSPHTLLVDDIPMNQKVEFKDAWNEKFTHSKTTSVENKESSEMNYEKDILNALKNLIKEKFNYGDSTEVVLGDLRKELKILAVKTNRALEEIYEDYGELCKIVDYKFFGIISIDYSMLGKLFVGAITTAMAGMINFVEAEKNNAF